MNISRFSRHRPLALASLACALALALSGCAATSITGATAVPAAEAPAKKKAEPVRISMPALDAFRGDGIFFFDDNLRSQFRISDSIAVNGRWPVIEKFDRGASHGFTWGAGAATLLRNGQPQPLASPTGISAEKSGTVLIHYGDPKAKTEKPLTLRIELTAYDLSGLPIGPYLKTRAGGSTTAGWLIANRYVFPEGSVGYRTKASIDSEEVLVPTQKAFTGSATIEDFSKRFARDIPFCLRFLPSKNAEPIGLLFSSPIAKKTKTVKVKGRTRTEEAAQSGEAAVFPVKKDTLFCSATGSQIGTAKWDLRYVNGTRVLSFTFPKSIQPSNYGLIKAHGDALRLAFAEENVKGKRGSAAKQVRPAALWRAKAPVLDQQWRFNATAADAVSDAIRLTASARSEWEAEHKGAVQKR